MNNHSIRTFLTRLNWKVQTGELVKLTEFQIDVYRFSFKEPLKEKNFTEFTGFLQKLDMTKLRSVMILFVWFYQHEIRFQLRFGYNPRLPFRYNMKNLFEPKRVCGKMLKCGHEDLMSCPLDLLIQKTGG